MSEVDVDSLLHKSSFAKSNQDIYIIYIYIYIYIYIKVKKLSGWGCPCGVMMKMLDCSFKVNKQKLSGLTS